LVIDHESRKKEILRKALLLFADLGYASVTFQKIADSCGISRTYLYRYFHDKREILDESIHNFFTSMIRKQREIAACADLPAGTRLNLVLLSAVDSLFDERLALPRILEYLLSRKTTGEDISDKIIRHTWKIRLLIHRLLAEGTRTGEFRPTELRSTNNLLYSQLETLAFRLIMRGDTSRRSTTKAIEIILDGLRADEE